MSSYEAPPAPCSSTYTHPDALSSLAVDNMSFDFVFPSCEPSTPPSFSFDSFPLDLPYQQPQTTNYGHARSRSNGSVYSFVSTAESTPDSVSTRMTTPSRASPPIRQHGPLLLPKIRSQDQAIESPPAKRVKPSPRTRTPAPAPRRSVVAAASAFRPAHARSYTNPETITWNMPSSFCSQPEEPATSSLLCSPVIFADDMQSRRASTCSLDAPALEKYGFPTYRQMPSYSPAASAPAVPQPPAEAYMFPSQCSYNAAPRAPSPLSISSTPDPTPSTTIMSYLTGPNPAPSLVRTISFPLRDPNTKHFWWDVRQIRPWTTFNISSVLSLPGAAALLNCPVPAPLLPVPAQTARHPETEATLHAIYASHYLPKLNAALAISSPRPMQLSAPAPAAAGKQTDLLFTASPAGEPASAAAIFGGKPTARVVGIVRSFDRFNTGMRVEGNIKRVEYLRGLAALHHAMREHGCRYGFVLTEIELIVVRNGPDAVPNFGFLEVTSVPLASVADDDDDAAANLENGGRTPLTACLALWGLCMMAGDDAPSQGVAHWKAEIGAPAEGTRRKALPRDEWMPKPQLAEKREAKRSRGWIMPEDPVGRKELGKRGVRYGAC